MKTARFVVFLMFAAVTRVIAAQPADPIDTLRERFVASVLPVKAADVAAVHQAAARHRQRLGPDGLWPDISFENPDRVSWAGGRHLERVLVMAKSARLKSDAGARDVELTSRTLAALRAWTGPDRQNPNWWWNRIGIPEAIGEIDCLLWSELSDGDHAAGIRILQRSTLTNMTGANLTWSAINQVVLGCLEQSEPRVRAAYNRLYEEVRLADAAAKFEGIQSDYSFHQHGAQLYSGGYGLFFADDVGRFLYVADGTPFQMPPDRRRLFDAYLLDGIRWMTWRDLIDYSTISREIAREGIVAAPKDWSLGPVAPTGPAYSLGNVVRMLATLPGPRQAEYAAWARSLDGEPAGEFTGNKHFWRSDYMVHRTSSYLATVKMFSTRMRNGEIINGEGRKSHHLSDGANFLYLGGHEYRDVFPAWDWQKVPGTTAEQMADMDLIEKNAVGTRSVAGFVGGVSDGEVGLCAMDLQRGSLTAQKTWFFYGAGYLCLGSGITSTTARPVITSVNQTRLIGDVRTSASEKPSSQTWEPLRELRWVYHDGVGYVFGGASTGVLSAAIQSGRWSDIGAGSANPVTIPMFNLWIEHGRNCRDASYQYVVLPHASVEETIRQAATPEARLLANTPDVQAAVVTSRALVGAAFFSRGEVDSPLGRLQVDQPCLVLVRRRADGVLAVTASNPMNKPLQVVVRIGEQSVVLNLPAGDAAGSSVTELAHAVPAHGK